MHVGRATSVQLNFRTYSIKFSRLRHIRQHKMSLSTISNDFASQLECGQVVTDPLSDEKYPVPSPTTTLGSNGSCLSPGVRPSRSGEHFNP